MRDVVVLAYHAVADVPNALAVRQDRLEDQVRWFLSRGYRPVTFTEAVLGTAPGKVVAITFDDGFASVHSRALPTLRSLGAVATAFVVTGLVGAEGAMSWPGLTPDPLPSDELRPMTWGQVRALADEGWEIGSHTVTHPRLPSLPAELLRLELEESRLALQHLLGVAEPSLAYPFGEADARVVAAAAAAGYRVAATMHRPPGGGPLTAPRVGVYSCDGTRRFAVKVARATRTRAAAAVLSGVHRLR